MKPNLHRCRLGKRVATISMAWRAEPPCGAFGFGHCGWNGKLAAVTNANGFVTAYAYDVMDRLASDGGVTYTYDAAGNRMTKTENGEAVIYTLGEGDRLASYGRARSPSAPQLVDVCGAYSYDEAGCVTRMERDGSPTLDLVWNGQYQLVSVLTNGIFAEGYAYDALGRRVATTTREGTTRHAYDEGWQVVADVDGQGNVLASYVWGERIDRLLAVKLGEATYYPLTDVQGTVWGYVDSSNAVVARWQYDAWGNVVEESVSVPALAALRYRFQGREWSAVTGLINFRMRWYDSVTGRWLSKDPIGLSGGLNLYAFTHNSPNNNIDPMGTIESGRRTDGPSLVERVKNWVKALFSSPQETVLPPTSGTAASALEGVPTFVPLLQQIDALNESIHALESGGGARPMTREVC